MGQHDFDRGPGVRSGDQAGQGCRHPVAQRLADVGQPATQHDPGQVQEDDQVGHPAGHLGAPLVEHLSGLRVTVGHRLDDVVPGDGVRGASQGHPTVEGPGRCGLAAEAPQGVARGIVLPWAPVAGEVIEVNDGLADDLDALSEDPYGRGWMIRLKAEDASSINELFDEAGYREFCASADH